jgi:hypothetical protein
MDWEEFYVKHIPKSHLPSDYGGDLDSVEDLHQHHRKSFMEMREYFLVEEKQMKFSFEDFVEEYTPPGNMFSPE